MRRPPRCPNRDCPNHRNPEGKFYVRHGTYRAQCRPQPIRRYRCKACRKTFSDQTFRGDRNDKKPHLNALVLRLLSSGVGFRFGSRMVGLSRRNYTRKARKLARVVSQLDANLQLRARRQTLRSRSIRGVTIQMDELETYEECRYSRPVIIANVIEAETRFQIASEVGSIRAKGKMTKRRVRQIKRDQERFGPRPDESPKACVRAFERAARLFPSPAPAHIQTDMRATYPKYIRAAFPGRAITHTVTPGKAPRGFGTPLHPITLMEAICRAHLGRVRRESWLTSKRRRYLQLFMDTHRAVKNWALSRFNRDLESPGQLLGFAPRKLRFEELFRWRQDWGQRSPCPFGDGRRSMLDLDWTRISPGARIRVCA